MIEVMFIMNIPSMERSFSTPFLVFFIPEEVNFTSTKKSVPVPSEPVESPFMVIGVTVGVVLSISVIFT